LHSSEKRCVRCCESLRLSSAGSEASVTVTRLPLHEPLANPRMLENLAPAIVAWGQKVKLPPTRNQLSDTRRSWGGPRELIVLASEGLLRALAHHPDRTRACRRAVLASFGGSVPVRHRLRATGSVQRQRHPDILTEVSCGVDKYLRFVDAHQVRPLPPRCLST
jgi:hypothetical protein